MFDKFRTRLISGWRQAQNEIGNEWRTIVSSIRWAILAVPALVMMVVFASAYTSWHSLLCKEFQEYAGPAVMVLAAVLSAIIARIDRNYATIWMFWLCGALFVRELHFWGTNNGIYVALVVLAVAALMNLGRLRAVLADRGMLGWLIAGFGCYVVGFGFDQGWFKPMRLFDGLRDPMEESLETAGHLMMLACVCSTMTKQRWETAKLLTRQRGLELRRRWLLVTAVALPVMVLTVGGFLWQRSRMPRTRLSDPLLLEIVGEQSSISGLPPEISALCPIDSRLADARPGNGHFLAASDESRDLYVCQMTIDGQIVVLHPVPLNLQDDEGGLLGLDDLEDLAWDGKQTYYAVTSHRHLLPDEEAQRNRFQRGTEQALVRFELRNGPRGIEADNVRRVCSDLLAKIRGLGILETVNWRNSKTLHWQTMHKAWQIDIEGLAVVGDEVLLGLKNPVEQGRATLLSLNLVTDELRVAARPRLDGQGILGMHFDEERDQLLVLTNDPQPEIPGESRLWIARKSQRTPGTWEFDTSPSEVFPRRPHARLQKAAGVTVIDHRLLVSFDDSKQAVIEVYQRP